MFCILKVMLYNKMRYDTNFRIRKKIRCCYLYHYICVNYIAVLHNVAESFAYHFYHLNIDEGSITCRKKEATNVDNTRLP